MGFMKKAFEEEKRTTASVGSVLIFVLMLVMFWGIADAETMSRAEIEEWLENKGSGALDLSDYEKRESDTTTVTDFAKEGATTDITYVVKEENVCNVTFRLTWEDEEEATLRHTNQPDKITIEVSNNDGSVTRDVTQSNPEGGQGVIEFTVRLFDEDDPPAQFPFINGTGSWNISVTVEAGDHEPLVPDPFGLRTLVDDGNAFSLEIFHEYLKKE